MSEVSLPAGWGTQLAADCFGQISTTNSKVKTKDCLQSGKFPVVDQGQDYISGYINDKDKVITIDTPVIIFGDHTRIIKWVDFNFVPGADGTKVLLPHEYINARFSFYQLKSIDIPDKGYSRHFKFFKELDFAIPPLAEQKVIADKLDTLLAQVEATKARLERIPDILKRVRQSVLAAAMSGQLTEEWRSNNNFSLSLNRYLESIDDFKVKAKRLSAPIEKDAWLSCQLGHVVSVKSGDGLNSKDMNFDGGIPVYGGNGINGYHDKSNNNESVVVIGRVGFYCGAVHLTEEKSWVTDNALIVNFPERLLTKKFVYWFLTATNLREDSASSAQPVISGTKVYQIGVNIPPIEEQTEIVRRVEQLFAFAESIEQEIQGALARMHGLTQSILAKAFRGELTADWRAANPDLISGDNSAASLLSRIKAEREALNKQLKPKRAGVKKKTEKAMSKQIIKVVEALKQVSEPLSGQQLLAAAGYPSDSSTEQLEQFFLDIREALMIEKNIVKLERTADGQDWFSLTDTARK